MNGSWEARIGDARARAVDWLLQQQHPDGWWSGELETNVTMTAEHVLLLRFLGIDVAAIRAGAVRHILGEQREDGSWALYYDGPADLSTTIEAYVALKVLGVDPSSAPMQRALTTIRQQGGLARARVFTKIWLALFGEYPWDGIPTLPPEVILLPDRAPFSLYDFACWARGTIAPLTIVIARRPIRELGVSARELIVAGTEHELHHVPGSGAFWWLDVLLKRYEHLPRRPARDIACRRVADWIVERQEPDGSWGGIQPPWVYSLIALNLEGYGLEHPVMQRGLRGMERFVIDDARGWRFLACMSPVWDTAWALRGLRAAGLPPSHPALVSATRWLLDEQIPADHPGDWRVRCAGVECGGWAFEFDNDTYPDIDDTTIVVLALLEAGEDSPRMRAALERARRWTIAMRSSNGGWAAFDRDNTRELVYRIPFADFGALIDPPTEDVTAHVVEMLVALGAGLDDPDVQSGLRFLRRTQTERGSWYGRWGVNYVYGTWCVLSALGAANTDAAQAERGAEWLIAAQNPDGGWGETCHSYVDPSFAGVGPSTASQTAWAVNGLQLSGLGNDPAALRGLVYLVEHQRPDGTWDEPEYTGTGFPGDFYINYHLYRHVFPLATLAAAATPAGRPEAPSRPTVSAW